MCPNVLYTLGMVSMCMFYAECYFPRAWDQPKSEIAHSGKHVISLLGHRTQYREAVASCTYIDVSTSIRAHDQMQLHIETETENQKYIQ